MVINPLLSMAKAEPVLPPVIEKDTGSSPVVTTEPTEVPFGSVSETLNVWPAVIASVTSVTSMVTGFDCRGVGAVGHRQAQGVGAGRIEVEVGIVSNTQLAGGRIDCKDTICIAGSDRPAGKRGCGINVGGGYTAKREAVGCILRDAEGLGRIDRQERYH